MTQPDPYPTYHKYLRVGEQQPDAIFVIAEEDLTAFYEEKYRHYVNGCDSCGPALDRLKIAIVL